RQLSPMAVARDHFALAVDSGKLYAIGGRLGNFAVKLDANEEYDPAADSWSLRAPLPTPRSGVAGATLAGRVQVFGGEEPRGTFTENEAYDPIANSWSSLAPMPSGRHGLGAVAFGTAIYVLAGGDTPGGSATSLNQAFSYE